MILAKVGKTLSCRLNCLNLLLQGARQSLDGLVNPPTAIRLLLEHVEYVVRKRKLLMGTNSAVLRA